VICYEPVALAGRSPSRAALDPPVARACAGLWGLSPARRLVGHGPAGLGPLVTCHGWWPCRGDPGGARRVAGEAPGGARAPRSGALAPRPPSIRPWGGSVRSLGTFPGLGEWETMAARGSGPLATPQARWMGGATARLRDRTRRLRRAGASRYPGARWPVLPTRDCLVGSRPGRLAAGLSDASQGRGAREVGRLPPSESPPRLAVEVSAPGLPAGLDRPWQGPVKASGTFPPAGGQCRPRRRWGRAQGDRWRLAIREREHRPGGRSWRLRRASARGPLGPLRPARWRQGVAGGTWRRRQPALCGRPLGPQPAYSSWGEAFRLPGCGPVLPSGLRSSLVPCYERLSNREKGWTGESMCRRGTSTTVAASGSPGRLARSTSAPQHAPRPGPLAAEATGAGLRSGTASLEAQPILDARDRP
jgi:hypothetical protein